MSKSFNYIWIFIGLSFVFACTTSGPRYSVSMDNVSRIKQYGMLGENKVKLGNFTSYKPGLTSIQCRGFQTIQTPDNLPFEDFIKKAFSDELKFADVYSDDSKNVITGHLVLVGFNSNSGEWTFNITIASPGGESYLVKSTYNFTTSFSGTHACDQTARSLTPAVQDLIGDIVSNPGFAKVTKVK